MKKIRIDHNVPMPVRFYPGKEIEYPFSEMKVGDSFFIGETGESPSWIYIQARIMAEALAFRKHKKPDWIFASSHIYAPAETKLVLGSKGRYYTPGEGVRCWRIK